jgi:hypothetical protein
MSIASCILMIRPANFGFNAETAANNYFQNNIQKSQKELQGIALKEFDKMVATLRKNNIEVLVINDTENPRKPDAIFPNNWLSTSPNGTVSVFPMYARNRRLEKREDIIDLLTHQYLVSNFQDWSEYEVEGKFLEGTGSMIIDYEHRILYACLSDRTHPGVIEKFASTNQLKAFTFTATDAEKRPIYHTNVMMCLGNKFAVVCEDSIQNEYEKIALQQLLSSTQKEIISISLQQMNSFAGNMLQVKNKDEEIFLVMSQTAYNSLSQQQIKKLSSFNTLLPIAVPTIENVEGGSVRCMMAEIFLDKK